MDQNKLCFTSWVNSLRDILGDPLVAFYEGLNQGTAKWREHWIGSLSSNTGSAPKSVRSHQHRLTSLILRFFALFISQDCFENQMRKYDWTHFINWKRIKVCGVSLSGMRIWLDAGGFWRIYNQPPSGISYIWNPPEWASRCWIFCHHHHNHCYKKNFHLMSILLCQPPSFHWLSHLNPESTLGVSNIILILGVRKQAQREVW